MILTAWENLKDYELFIGQIVSNFMSQNDVVKMPTGRYELEDGCYVNVDVYETRENYNFEAHRKYIDVQLLVEGEEIIYVESIDKGIESMSYNQEKDIAFYSCDYGPLEYVKVSPGNAVVLFPEDMHAPCNAKEKRHNRKLVFKIPVELVHISQKNNSRYSFTSTSKEAK